MNVDTIMVNLQIGPDLQDITDSLQLLVHDSGITNGHLSVFVVGSTGSITTIEYEPGVVQDLKDALSRLAPPGIDYAHEQAWHDGNGHSHVQAAILGPSLSIPIRSGRLRLGTWQQVVVVNHDNCPRQRVVEVTLVGGRL
ncbi:MAG: secondary thiamine-phosphate synthase enzyme YjbQ [Deltaproteobacteria bacterium]|nr:secondary thiamine-phosphate synthase enzyme YjbQ [Deltaproteobacteria bacterium]